MLKMAICDDEDFYLDKIKKQIDAILLKKDFNEYSIDIYKSGIEICKKGTKLCEYQVIFLDINMNNLNGIETAKKIREFNQDVIFVFITAYADYAMEGYQVEAIRYILKDMLEKMLPECMNAVLKKLRISSQRMTFNFVDGKREILINDICYIESIKHKLVFKLSKRKQITYVLYDKMDNIENSLLEYGFLRIHKSYLVNINCIVEICNYKASLKTGELLPIPREKYQLIKEKYYENEGNLI